MLLAGVAVERHHLTGEALGLFGRERDGVEPALELARRIGHGEARLGHHQVDERFAVRADQRAEPTQDARARVGGWRAVDGSARGTHGQRHLLARGLAHESNGVLRVAVVHRKARLPL